MQPTCAFTPSFRRYRPRSGSHRAGLLTLSVALTFLGEVWAGPPAVLPGTEPIEAVGDLGAEMVTGLDRYLDRELAARPDQRLEGWRAPREAMRAAADSGRPVEAGKAFLGSLLATAETHRVRLRHLLGVVDAREPVQMRLVATLDRSGAPSGDPAEVGRAPGYRVIAVAWNVFRGVEGEGLLLVPDGEPQADVIAVPDCDWTPEQAVGLAPGVPVDQQFPRRFAEAGCRVLVPALIDRGDRFAGNPGVRSLKHSQRETLWRAGYEMGRTPLGYEIQKVLAAADWLDATRTAGPRRQDWSTTQERIQNPGTCRQELGIIGYGEGGLLALYAGALDLRFLAVGVCGAFGLADRNAEQPLYRNVWSVLERFGDVELLAMILPRAVLIEHGKYPEVVHTDQYGGAPGRLWRPEASEIEALRERLGRWLPELPAYFLTAGPDAVGDWATSQRLYRKLSSTGEAPQTLGPVPEVRDPQAVSDAVTAARTRRQYLQLLEDTQHLMREAEYTRREFWKRANFGSLAAFTNTATWYRDYFAREMVGMIPPASLPPRPRSRLLYETNGVCGYEVRLEVHPDVFACGILCVPGAALAEDATGSRGRRPVVVCQHGLEGRPRDVADPSVRNEAYHQYALRLAERGYVTFAPQNPYLGGTRFRQVLRKAQPLGLTLWSFIVRQHEVITDWLASLDFVDPQRLGFYGLSYGGKTAMRVPVLVDRYCLSICSADYNEWIWKNVSARAPYSYLWTIEYDMPEFNLGNTFNYAELSWLICPRPFMVERGHDDGVAPDEWVAFEYARTRRHYVKLGIGDRTDIEFFDGPHSIHGVGTFDFLDRHLRPATR